MNYTTLGVINSAPQDMILSETHNLSRVVAAKNRSRIVSHTHDTPDEEQDHITSTLSKCSSSDLSKTNDDVDFENQTEGSISDKNININNNDYSVNNNDSSDLKITTKIQLNFSVDRLLGTNDRVVSAFDLSNHKHLSGNSGCPTEACRNNRSIGGYQCCKFASNVHNSLAYNFVNDFTQSTPPITTQVLTETAILSDVKSIVRPTPIRAANRVNTVFSHPLTIGFHGSQTLVRYQPAVTSTLQGNLSSISQVKIVNTSIESAYRSNLTHTDPNRSLTTASTSGSPGTIAGGSEGTTATTNNKRKRSWSRAVFSNLQRKGLEIQFQVQKYITKPDRRKLAARLNLTDAQVKVWFQNRRMKWRHTRENLKSGQEKPLDDTSKIQEDPTTTSSEDDEIDVVAE